MYQGLSEQRRRCIECKMVFDLNKVSMKVKDHCSVCWAAWLQLQPRPAGSAGVAKYSMDPYRDNSPMLGCYGDSLATTPNIDKPSEALYTHAYAMRRYAPSRAIITGYM